MHIDHLKLVELLVETSGIEKEKVEAQLQELVTEIKTAIEEGDAYEVEGLGVFSGIGNNVIFIPSDELSTEINYKYVGMEPIEMDDAPEAEQEPEAPQETADDDPDDDDPFAGLLGDLDSDEPSQPAASFELDVPEEEEPSEPVDSKETTEEQGEDPFALDTEEQEPEAGKEDPEKPIIEKPGPDKWGIDTYKDDTAETTFSGLLGNKEEKEETEEDATEQEHLSANLEEGKSEEPEEKSILDDFKDLEESATEEDEDTEPALLDQVTDSDDEEDEEEDFDDPFEALAGDVDEDQDDENEDEDEEEEKLTLEQKEPEEVIPVIKNLASESSKKKKAKEEKEGEEESEPDSRKSRKVAASDPKTKPVMLWILLLIIILGGGTYALGYFGVVHIDGITPQQQVASSTTVPTQPTPQPETTPQQEQQEEQTAAQPEQPQEQPPQETTPVQEQKPPSQVSTEREVPADQPAYGMNGVPVAAANDGYTIVVYSLSRENSAKAKQRELSEQGYRALLATVPSQQYGTLWRVSLGQFQTMRDAALAAEELVQPFSENYFITKIQ